jgi:hypothetical protein
LLEEGQHLFNEFLIGQETDLLGSLLIEGVIKIMPGSVEVAGHEVRVTDLHVGDMDQFRWIALNDRHCHRRARRRYRLLC